MKAKGRGSLIPALFLCMVAGLCTSDAAPLPSLDPPKDPPPWLPPLTEFSRACGQHFPLRATPGTYALRWFITPTFETPVVGTVILHGETGELRLDTLAGAGGYEIEGLLRSAKRRLSPGEVAIWKHRIRSLLAINSPTLRNNNWTVLDGVTHAIEAAFSGQYRMASRYCYSLNEDEPALNALFQACDNTSSRMHLYWEGSRLRSDPDSWTARRSRYSPR